MARVHRRRDAGADGQRGGERARAERRLGDVLPHLQALDGLFVNLECCLSTRGTPWTDTHRQFHYRADPEWAIPALEAAGVSWANLANNHVLDFEQPGFEDTLDHLDDAGMAHSGAGETEQAAREPALVSVGDLDVAVVSVTDTASDYAASEDEPGVAYARLDVEQDDQRELVGESLRRAKDLDPDLLVASLHWGQRMVVNPPAHHERFGRWLVEQGVDLVHGHSSHVLHGVEHAGGAPILYDTGNFVDDFAPNRGLRNDLSFLFVAGVADGDVQRLELHPVKLTEDAVQEASEKQAQTARDLVRERSETYGTQFDRDGEALVVEF
ncbi:CapA family protein [Haloarculaceae archaeon H-GB2-1]|nr:CapA family protein [Haloarculaceae archaeon H-GB2-1]